MNLCVHAAVLALFLLAGERMRVHAHYATGGPECLQIFDFNNMLLSKLCLCQDQGGE